MEDKEQILYTESEKVGQFFGLSYASWIVLPRVAIESMPIDWQDKLIDLVNEMEETLEFPEGYTGRFAVSMKAETGNKFVRNPLPHYRHGSLPKKEK